MLVVGVFLVSVLLIDWKAEVEKSMFCALKLSGMLFQRQRLGGRYLK